MSVCMGEYMLVARKVYQEHIISSGTCVTHAIFSYYILKG